MLKSLTQVGRAASQGLSLEEMGESWWHSPFPTCSIPCQGLGCPLSIVTLKGNVFPSDRISSGSSHRSFAKETAWSQQPGTDTSREAVEKAKAETENIPSIQIGFKPFLMLDPSLFQPQSLQLCSALQPFLSSSLSLFTTDFPYSLVF